MNVLFLLKNDTVYDLWHSDWISYVCSFYHRVARPRALNDRMDCRRALFHLGLRPTALFDLVLRPTALFDLVLRPTVLFDLVLNRTNVWGVGLERRSRSAPDH